MIKEKIAKILKHKFFVSQVNYPPQNGFLDYGPILVATKLEIIKSYRKILIDQEMYEIEPSAVLPYEVLKNSGHIDKFCDIVLSDGTDIYRADHLIKEKIGEIHILPEKITEKEIEEVKKIIKEENFDEEKIFDEKIKNKILSNFKTKKTHLDNCKHKEIDFIVLLNNLKEVNGAFSESKDFNLIFKLNENQFLRPEIAQSQFTSFNKVYELNNQKLPLATFSIGRSYRNEISARQGMIRTKEFEQAEIEYFTLENKHKKIK